MPGKKTTKNATVVVVDNDADARLYLQDILQMSGDFSCIGSFSNGADALKGIPQLLPDLVLMDIQMPKINGIECARRLRQSLSSAKIIMVTGLHGENSIKQALNAGASGYLIKPFTIAQCLATLKWAIVSEAKCKSKGKEFVPTASSETCPLLTERENEVMRCLATGLLYKEIADKLEISYSAVHKFQHRIFLKLKAANRTEAIINWRGETKEP
jgi:DNA-binding NarL/FixJ family response regulator